MKKLILPVVAAALSAAYAEERTVSTAADLVQALTELNASADADSPLNPKPITPNPQIWYNTRHEA